jgi:hypothetical protein
MAHSIFIMQHGTCQYGQITRLLHRYEILTDLLFSFQEHPFGNDEGEQSDTYGSSDEEETIIIYDDVVCKKTRLA